LPSEVRRTQDCSVAETSRLILPVGAGIVGATGCASGVVVCGAPEAAEVAGAVLFDAAGAASAGVGGGAAGCGRDSGAVFEAMGAGTTSSWACTRWVRSHSA
jgi:hypothetical protein